MECRALAPPAAVAAAKGEWWAREVGQIAGGFSHESEHDLALMVSDFLESGDSTGPDSWCSSDSDSGFSDLPRLAEKIQVPLHIIIIIITIYYCYIIVHCTCNCRFFHLMSLNLKGNFGF